MLRIWPQQSRPITLDSRRSWADTDLLPTKSVLRLSFGRIRPQRGGSRLYVAEFDETNFGPKSTRNRPIWANLGPISPRSINAGLNSTHFGPRAWPLGFASRCCCGVLSPRIGYGSTIGSMMSDTRSQLCASISAKYRIQQDAGRSRPNWTTITTIWADFGCSETLGSTSLMPSSSKPLPDQFWAIGPV